MADESDDRGSLRERLGALEAELATGRAALAELQTSRTEREQRLGELARRVSELEAGKQIPSSPRAKLLLSLLLLPAAALGGMFSGVTAGLPFQIAGLVLDVEGETWPAATMAPFVLLGTLSALTLALRALRRR